MDDINYNKAKFFFDLGWPVHITMQNSFIHNGFIEDLRPEFLVLSDERKGVIPLFFVEIAIIEKKEDKEKR